jgi:hypothetical protein
MIKRLARVINTIASVDGMMRHAICSKILHVTLFEVSSHVTLKEMHA